MRFHVFSCEMQDLKKYFYKLTNKCEKLSNTPIYFLYPEKKKTKKHFRKIFSIFDKYQNYDHGQDDSVGNLSDHFKVQIQDLHLLIVLLLIFKEEFSHVISFVFSFVDF